MDWLQFFASLVGSIAWPAAVVAVVVLLRTPLGKLLPLIRTLKYKELQIDWGAQLEEIKDQVEATTPAPSLESEKAASDLTQLADVDSRGAVLGAWIPLERELRQLAASAGIRDVMRIEPGWLVAQLHHQKHIDLLTYKTLMKLMKMRNEAVHLSDREITPADSAMMAQLCISIRDQIRARIGDIQHKGMVEK
ncbi:hypothetical protein [Pseudomonas alloputida]|uniref:hypothetical protein n=1 Tax=Pseudomonas alloputida TaxID=1940621 RepID=UPI001E30132F|nr:hypothetical protein [Pseudomonas alloputida]MCE1054127.1 hypothetical protein [Pseudomonas alloputida]